MPDLMKAHFDKVREMMAELLQQPPIPFRLLRIYSELLQELTTCMRTGTTGLDLSDMDDMDEATYDGIAVAAPRRARRMALDMNPMNDPMGAIGTIAQAAMPVLQAQQLGPLLQTIPHLGALYPDPVERQQALARIRALVERTAVERITGGAPPPPLPADGPVPPPPAAQENS